MIIADTPHAPSALTGHARDAIAQVVAGGRLDPLQQVSMIGGSALGFVLTSAFAQNTTGVVMPSWTLANPDEVASAAFEGYIKAVCTPGAGGILVKYSSINESFTVHARRGANSSAGAQFRTVDEHTAGHVLGAARHVTGTTRAILVQNIITLPVGRAGYIHAYTYGQAAVVEYITHDDTRLLFAGDGHDEFYLESTQGIPLDAGQRRAIVSHALVFSRFAADALTGDPVDSWNIEGCWDPDQHQLYLFQSRPSPTDRPADGLHSPLHPSSKPVWSTHWVWGAFDITASMGELTVRTEDDVHVGGPVEPLLPTSLVVATRAAFRLSHEPFFLPPVARRDGYRFVHVPQAIVDQIGSSRVRFHSNGDQCHVLPA